MSKYICTHVHQHLCVYEMVKMDLTAPWRGWSPNKTNRAGSVRCVVQIKSSLFEFLKSRSYRSMLCEFLGVQGFSEGSGLVGVSGNYGASVGDGVGSGSDVAWRRVKVLPGE